MMALILIKALHSPKMLNSARKKPTLWQLKPHHRKWASHSPDQRKLALSLLRAASNATTIINTLKPFKQNYRISWNLLPSAPKRFKNWISKKEFRWRNSLKDSSATKLSISLAAQLIMLKRKSSNSIFNMRKKWRNFLMKFARKLFQRLLANLSLLLTLSGFNTWKSWTKDYQNLN